MKNAVVLLATLVSISAFAHDSTWKLCQGETQLFGEKETILVNLYEHRSPSGRATDLTLIFGGNILTGSFDSTDSDAGKVNLTQQGSSFTGEAKVDYSAESLEIKGALSLSGSTTSVNSILTCKTIRE